MLVRIADSKGEKRFIAVPIQQIVQPTALFKKPASKSSDLNEADRVLDHVRVGGIAPTFLDLAAIGRFQVSSASASGPRQCLIVNASADQSLSALSTG